MALLKLLQGAQYSYRIPAGAGLGGLVPGSKAKVILHSTETDPGTANAIINAWWNDWGRGMPTFFMDRPWLWIQTLPLDVGAYTLQNPAGGVDTNRGGDPCIQVEICNHAPNARVWGAAGTEWSKSIARWLADLVLAGVDVDLEVVYEFTDSRHVVRIPGALYYGVNAVIGHQHAPEQPGGHWDPGPIDIAWILAEARRLVALALDPNQPPEEDPEDEDMAKTTIMVADSRDNAVYELEATGGILKRRVHGTVQFKKLNFLGVPFTGWGDHDLLDARELYPPAPASRSFGMGASGATRRDPGWTVDAAWVEQMAGGTDTETFAVNPDDVHNVPQEDQP